MKKTLEILGLVLLFIFAIYLFTITFFIKETGGKGVLAIVMIIGVIGTICLITSRRMRVPKKKLAGDWS